MKIRFSHWTIKFNPVFFLVAFSLLFFLLISLFSVFNKSLTYDEPYHYQYGMNIVNGDSSRFDDSKMPFSIWNALPARVASYLPDGRLKIELQKMVVARFMTILFSLAVAYIVFHWARKLYGLLPAFVSLGLYIFDPNIIAHSQLVTTDIYMTGMVLVCSYWLWKFANSRAWQDGLIFSVLLGFAQLAKYTAISLYPVFAITFLIHDYSRLREEINKERRKGIQTELWRYFKYAVAMIVIGAAIINIGFLFNRTFTPLRDYQFRSELFRAIQTRIDFPVPTPYPYLEGLDWITAKERTNLGFIYVYLLGHTRFGQGFHGYYIVASLLKVPIATQIIIWISLVAYFVNKQRRQFFWKNEWFLLSLVFFYTIYFNFFYKAQIGIRYYLIVFPLLYVFTGGLFIDWNHFKKFQKTILCILAVGTVCSVLSQYPNYLAYFNELIGNHKQAYKYLADSNLDWGQDNFALQQYKLAHHKVLKAPEIPSNITEPAIYYVSVNRLVGVINGPQPYQWLRENFEPMDTIGGSYLVYKITPAQMQVLCENTNFCH
jgi:hypothetical protein